MTIECLLQHSQALVDELPAQGVQLPARHVGQRVDGVLVDGVRLPVDGDGPAAEMALATRMANVSMETGL